MTAGQRSRSVESMRDRRDASNRRRTQIRQQRWEQQRFAVPYPTDGPKISLGILWFVAVVGAGWLATPLLAAVVAGVAGLAAWQVGTSFQPIVDPAVASGIAVVIALSGVFGALGVGVGMVLGTIGAFLIVAGLASPEPVLDRRGRPVASHEALLHRGELLVRSSLPGAVAAASLVAIERLDFGGFVAIVVLISAYEIGDFLIGSGSANAVEGPVAGIVALAVAGAGVYLVLPAPFDTNSFPLFAVLTAVAAPLGQIAASAVLPRGVVWAPALRRLDSSLLAAPLWLLLMPRV